MGVGGVTARTGAWWVVWGCHCTHATPNPSDLPAACPGHSTGPKAHHGHRTLQPAEYSDRVLVSQVGHVCDPTNLCPPKENP